VRIEFARHLILALDVVLVRLRFFFLRGLVLAGFRGGLALPQCKAVDIG
jgi:hypothetical protein